MSMREQEEKLFKEWRVGLDRFVPDGIVDESAYRSAKLRIIYILKETNDFSGDLRKFVREGGRWQTWDNIARWTYGLQRLGTRLNWNDELTFSSKEEAKAFRIDHLQGIGAVNLKKTPGGDTTDWKQLKDSTGKNADNLRRQFGIYFKECPPDLMICCGSSVAQLTKEVLGLEEWSKTTRGVGFSAYKNGSIVISYAHPEARVADNILYYGLIDSVREIRLPE